MITLKRTQLAISGLIAVMLQATTANAEVKICHIANAGFFFEASGNGVLVDAVMQRDDYNQRFALPSASTLADMQTGTGAFSAVKLALVTHKHGDHFDAAASLKHLRIDKGVEYIMPPEAFNLMQAEGLTDTEAKRVHPILPDWRSGPVSHTVGDIRVEIYRIDHGPNMPQNLGYRVTLGETSFFHTGDINATDERLKNAGLNKTYVDYMLMPFWFALQQKPAVESAWNISTMIPMHYHAKEQSWMAQYGGPEGLRRSAASIWPNSIRIDKEMQCKKLDS